MSSVQDISRSVRTDGRGNRPSVAPIVHSAKWFFARPARHASWMAGACIVLAMLALNLTRRCAALGSREILVARAERLHEPVGVVVVRYTYGWPWGVARTEGSVAIVKHWPLELRPQAFELREVYWAKLGLSVMMTALLTFAVFRAADRVRAAHISPHRITRRIIRFRLKTLLTLIAISAILFNFILLRCIRQHQLVSQLKGSGAIVLYDDEDTLHSRLGLSQRPTDTYWNRLASHIVGEYGVGRVYAVFFISQSASPEQLRQLTELGQLDAIALGPTSVNKSLIDALQGQDSLWAIIKEGLTDEEAMLLRESFPDTLLLKH